MTRLPAPEQWVIQKMDEMEVAEMIERHIDYYTEDKDGNRRSVHLPMQFVRHFVKRDNEALPTILTIVTLPMVLPDGRLKAPEGLDRASGVLFKIQKELRAMLPNPKDCNETAVRKAMQFLCDTWLCDVAADYAGKCVIIAAALTLIERVLLDERPVFWVTAGHAKVGKTTLLYMLIMAVTGFHPAAAAWSNDVEERRKALLGYLLAGVAYILWDNITKGSRIHCPHIEKSCTSRFYTDRKLGVSETATTDASVVHVFTGNNVGAKGDLSSRSLHTRLTVNSTEPENRNFKHPYPVQWTEEHRGEILQALYTILLGNPQLKMPRDAPAKTRFKSWWRMVGSAVEHAAKLHMPGLKQNEEVDFQKLFIEQEEKENEDAASLADALEIIEKQWGNDGFFAKDVADFLNNKDTFNKPEAIELCEFLFPNAPKTERAFMPSVRSVGRMLAQNIDAPVKVGERTLILRKKEETTDQSMKGTMKYHIYSDPPAAKQADPKAAKDGKKDKVKSPKPETKSGTSRSEKAENLLKGRRRPLVY